MPNTIYRKCVWSQCHSHMAAPSLPCQQVIYWFLLLTVIRCEISFRIGLFPVLSIKVFEFNMLDGTSVNTINSHSKPIRIGSWNIVWCYAADLAEYMFCFVCAESVSCKPLSTFFLQLEIACWDNKVDVASHGTIRAIAFPGYDANRCPCLPSHTSTMTTALMEDKIIHYRQLRTSSTNLLLSGDNLIMQPLITSSENSTFMRCPEFVQGKQLCSQTVHWCTTNGWVAGIGVSVQWTNVVTRWEISPETV